MFDLHRFKLDNLFELCKEIAKDVKDDQIAILPQDRQYIAAALKLYTDTTQNDLECVSESLHELHAVLLHLSNVVNLQRYYRLEENVRQAFLFIDRYSLYIEQPKSDVDLRTKLTLFLLNKGVISHESQLQQGNSSSIVNAYIKGFLSLTEAYDAISAASNCRHSLQLHQIRTHSAFGPISSAV